ncbi:MAG: RnfABCDGE type electron transport complex subunit D [Candidatus Omnitrophica bacterium]|nr:RnfABCDGE type electron transport complex subunit D [Candidatus Omnitrophota bacterium]
MEDNLLVSFWPHIQMKDSISKIMWTVFMCLVPAGIAGVYFFGLHSLLLIFISIITAVLTEGSIQLIRKNKITIYDGTAALTGLLLAYNLPPTVPFWIPIIGSFFAIAIAKQAFGGLGRNIFNPALSARVFLLLSWPTYMTAFVKPFGSADTISSATPLSILKEGEKTLSDIGLTYMDLFLGRRAGCIGEVAVFLLLLGALVLLFLKIITLHIPLSFIFVLAIFSWIFDKQGLFKGDVLFSIMSGGVILGAFFMATDYVTSPLTKKGKVVFGIGCGLLTFIIRRFAGYPEGVSFSILIMNAFSPLIDRIFKPPVYGKK